MDSFHITWWLWKPVQLDCHLDWLHFDTYWSLNNCTCSCMKHWHDSFRSRGIKMESIKVAIQLHWFPWPPRYVKLVYYTWNLASVALFMYFAQSRSTLMTLDRTRVIRISLKKVTSLPAKIQKWRTLLRGAWPLSTDCENWSGLSKFLTFSFHKLSISNGHFVWLVRMTNPIFRGPSRRKSC